MMRTKEMKNVDLFVGDKAMNGRVEEFVKCRVLYKAIRKDYESKIQKAKDEIISAENCDGSMHAKTPEEKLALYEKLENIIKERDNLISKDATFEFTKADRVFKKALKGLSMDSPVIAEAIIEWFSNYNLDVTDSLLLADIISAIGGKEDIHKLVDSNGADGVSVDNNRALSMVYWVTFKHLVAVNLIKPAQIPEIIGKNFGEKARAEIKERKRQLKKSQKNNK